MPFDLTIIEPDDRQWPTVLRCRDATQNFGRIWAVGDLGILKTNPVGWFCSASCPGDVILATYDLVRRLRDAGIPIISGFHSPMEKESLDLLLRGRQPIVICPARGVQCMRLPSAWKVPLTDGRLLVLSPFDAKYNRPTTELAKIRNDFIALLADRILIPHAAPGSKSENFGLELLSRGRQLFMLDRSQNPRLVDQGAMPMGIDELVARLSVSWASPCARSRTEGAEERIDE